MKKLQLLLLVIYKKYNDLVLHHILSVPLYIIVTLLYYWFTGDTFATSLFVFLMVVLYCVPVYFVNKKRTCPSCKTWIYSDYNIRSKSSQFICKKCNAEWD